MSDVMSMVPEDHPLMQAWKAHQATADFAISKHWAAVPEHLQGSLWALFVAGFMAGIAEGRRQGLEEAAAMIRTHRFSKQISHLTRNGRTNTVMVFPRDARDELDTAIRALIKEPGK